jgi:hypothetical protein
MKTYVMRSMTVIFAVAGTCLAVGIASAVDGVVLINQNKAIAGGVTPNDAPGFPVTISRPGSYRLATNLTVESGSVHAIQITSQRGGVAIDLNGFTIRGPGEAGSGDGVNSAVGNAAIGHIVVMNGVIQGMGRFGVLVGGASRISNLQVIGNRFGGIRTLAGGLLGSVVSGNSIESNGGAGIDSLGTGDLISDNTLWFNSGTGIFAGGACVVRNNAVTNSASDGISAANGCLVISNTVRDSVGFGLRLDENAGYRDNVLTNNKGEGDNPQVQGGISLGSNVCGSDTVCP